MYRFAILLAACTLLVAPVAAADTSANEELNKILEQNGAAAAYAKICDDEPTSDQLKSTTMMLLAVNGLEAQAIQLGSAKFNDVMRREIASFRSMKNVDCEAKVKEARQRLTFTQAGIQAGHREAPNQ
jgi:hypothetical protein